VLTRDAAIEGLTSVIGVPATRTVRGIPSEVELTTDDGMPDRCVLSLDNIRVLQKSYFRERICALGPERMDAVCLALARATGCSGRSSGLASERRRPLKQAGPR
jgi:mRNA interferase MazF